MAKKPQTNLLNLDELATEEKVIVLDGTKHRQREFTVQEFIDRAKEAREAAKAAEAAKQDDPETLDQKLEVIIGMIHDAFPTISKERLGKLSLAQLNAILEFTVKTPAEIEQDVKAAQSAQGNG